MTNEILLEEMSRFLQDQARNLEVRNGSVFAKEKVARGTKYGPFIAKFTDKPLDRRFAWEVSGVHSTFSVVFLKIQREAINNAAACVFDD